ncbi:MULTISPECIES: hypothetical protein [Burkholderia]|uniref:Uncharacterized protein n=1 Tax=Burkholderia contaminans TaxID=488447 RepID=A0AAP1V8B7_9BURK|nr:MULTISPECIES: hypothetical protein [Burkholderia]UTP21438.1 hypothetical protein NMB33_13325 [Burkholderia sp. FXe9]MBH9689000.1 hypothetical protein [Burkholderia contaminans]MBK1902472.1 hypothetical protein [Burkholderia contaminans]MBK1910662.1 hypothetical protein [Burkholderia contaminans]MBK1924411.1 hypothetical protein [Burkholderia contaminans]
MDDVALPPSHRRTVVKLGKQQRRWIHVTGSALGALGTIFVGVKLVEYSHQLSLDTFSAVTWSAVATLGAGYGACGMLLALAWLQLLTHHGVTSSRLWAIKTYGVSQLAKYTPGNIFHLAGRQAICVAAGLPAWPVAKSIVWELAVIASTALPFALMAAPLKWPVIGTATAIAAFAGALAIAVSGIRTCWSLCIARAVSLYAAFLLVSGLIFSALLAITVQHAKIDTHDAAFWLPVCGAYVIAWLAGLVTPGAPAGVGVREAVLYWLMHGVVGQADLITAIVLGRMVTVAGDLMFFVGAALVPRPPH